MAPTLEQDIAIIGAGISGLTLALFLDQHNIPCTVYDLRSAERLPYSGPLALTPNGLRAADAVGLYKQLLPLGTSARHVTTISNENMLLDQREIGNAERYSYDALRVYRKDVINVLQDMVERSSVDVVYEKRFSRILAETGKDVTLEFSDGEQKVHTLVVGADGIHSAVRKDLHPQAKPRYVGRLAVAAMAPTSAIKLPFADYPLPTSVGSPFGHVILCPNDKADPACPVATGIQYPEQTREGWQDLENNKDELLSILRSNYDRWNSTVQSAMDAVDPETLFMWPFYTISDLPTWKSSQGRVVLVGDSAHGLPPIGALGANLALEDAVSLGHMIGGAYRGEAGWAAALDWWHTRRRERLAGVRRLTKDIAKKREEDRMFNGEQEQDQTSRDDSWVFSLDVGQEMQKWLEQVSVAESLKMPTP